jgi:hypothetical protein
MTLEGEQRIILRHPLAVVRDAQKPAPARFNVQLDAPRARVNRVFH